MERCRFWRAVRSFRYRRGLGNSRVDTKIARVTLPIQGTQVYCYRKKAIFREKPAFPNGAG
jgi:hypothetical protein